MDLSVGNLNLICTKRCAINKGIPHFPFRVCRFSPNVYKTKRSYFNIRHHLSRQVGMCILHLTCSIKKRLLAVRRRSTWDFNLNCIWWTNSRGMIVKKDILHIYINHNDLLSNLEVSLQDYVCFDLTKWGSPGKPRCEARQLSEFAHQCDAL